MDQNAAFGFEGFVNELEASVDDLLGDVSWVVSIYEIQKQSVPALR